MYPIYINILLLYEALLFFSSQSNYLCLFRMVNLINAVDGMGLCAFSRFFMCLTGFVFICFGNVFSDGQEGFNYFSVLLYMTPYL